jgi:predicted 3-demethylubiquinone-9 3-methyltransferase (glyoxalase superfamily)
MQNLHKISPCLWFDDRAQEAAEFYTGIFPNSKIVNISHYGEAGQQVLGKPAESVLTVAFELDGQMFTALNGGPTFKFNEAISFQVDCQDQAEVDYYWDKLSILQGRGYANDGDETAQQCGWLKDRYGVSWQIIPRILVELLNDPDAEKSQKAMTAMLQMKKIDIDELKRATAA